MMFFVAINTFCQQLTRCAISKMSLLAHHELITVQFHSQTSITREFRVLPWFLIYVVFDYGAHSKNHKTRPLDLCVVSAFHHSGMPCGILGENSPKIESITKDNRKAVTKYRKTKPKKRDNCRLFVLEVCCINLRLQFSKFFFVSKGHAFLSANESPRVEKNFENSK